MQKQNVCQHMSTKEAQSVRQLRGSRFFGMRRCVFTRVFCFETPLSKYVNVKMNLTVTTCQLLRFAHNVWSKSSHTILQSHCDNNHFAMASSETASPGPTHEPEIFARTTMLAPEVPDRKFLKVPEVPSRVSRRMRTIRIGRKTNEHVSMKRCATYVFQFVCLFGWVFFKRP